MKILSLLPFLLPILSAQTPTPPSPPQAAAPLAEARVKVLPAGMVNLGALGPQGSRTQTYQLQNTSRTPITLRLKDVPAGIQVAGPALDGPIPPGSSRDLHLELKALARTGSNTVKVVMVTDDPGQGLYQLPVQFVVRPDLTVEGERKVLNRVAPHESPQAVFAFLRETGATFGLQLSTPLPPYLEADTQIEGGAGELRLVLRPAKVPDGMRAGLETLKVTTTAPKEPEFTLYLAWNLAYPVEATPTRLVFLDVKSDELRATLASRDGKPFQIREARFEGEGFTVDPPAGEAAPKAELVVRRTGKGKAQATLVVRFQGDVPTLRIPVKYLPPEG